MIPTQIEYLQSCNLEFSLRFFYVWPRSWQLDEGISMKDIKKQKTMEVIEERPITMKWMNSKVELQRESSCSEVEHNEGIQPNKIDFQVKSCEHCEGVSIKENKARQWKTQKQNHSQRMAKNHTKQSSCKVEQNDGIKHIHQKQMPKTTRLFKVASLPFP